MLGRQAHRQLCMLSLNCISASPAALNRYLAAVPAMSLIPFAPLLEAAFAQASAVVELWRDETVRQGNDWIRQRQVATDEFRSQLMVSLKF